MMLQLCATVFRNMAWVLVIFHTLNFARCYNDIDRVTSSLSQPFLYLLWSLHKFIFMYILVPPWYKIYRENGSCSSNAHQNTLHSREWVCDCAAQTSKREYKNWNKERKWIVGGGGGVGMKVYPNVFCTLSK